MSEWTPASLRRRLTTMLSTGELALPFPGAGETPARHRALYEVSRTDLSLARLVEAHTDAVAIITRTDGCLASARSMECGRRKDRVSRWRASVKGVTACC